MNKLKPKLMLIVCGIALLGAGFVFFVRSRRTSAFIAPCVNNLLIIDMCKLNVANAKRKTFKDGITWEELKPELESYAIHYKWTNGVPMCPDGGIYTIGRVGERPTCSVGGVRHSLP